MPPAPVTLEQLIAAIRDARQAADPARALLVGLSGIDGAGKGWVAARLADALTRPETRVLVVGVDPWLNLPSIRFSTDDPGRHFYHNALRLEGFARDLLHPLKHQRGVDLIMQCLTETATGPVPERVLVHDVDIVLAEGIFLFKPVCRPLLDLAVWVDCSTETALARALERAQEGLGPEATALAYRTIYFPAQAIHLEHDRPRERADYLLPNDPLLRR